MLREESPSAAPGAYLPLQYYVDFLKWLNERRESVELITYDDLPWGDDYDFRRCYPEEWRNWEEQIASGMRSRHKVHLLLQHDLDSWPERGAQLLREEQQLGIRSDVMVFNRLVNRARLEETGELAFEDYPLDDDLLRQLQGEGFVIGYHCNAYEQARFDLRRAEEIFAEDVNDLRKRFDIRFFSAHGGVRDSAGRSNFCIDVPESLRRSVRWVHSGFSPKFHETYSDGGFASGKKAPEALDLRRFVRSWLPGRRYRVLVHPQYYHPRPSRLPAMDAVPWYRDAWSAREA